MRYGIDDASVYFQSLFQSLLDYRLEILMDFPCGELSNDLVAYVDASCKNAALMEVNLRLFASLELRSLITGAPKSRILSRFPILFLVVIYIKDFVIEQNCLNKVLKRGYVSFDSVHVAYGDSS